MKFLFKKSKNIINKYKLLLIDWLNIENREKKNTRKLSFKKVNILTQVLELTKNLIYF